MRRTRLTATTGVFLLLCGLAFLMYIDRSNVSIAAPVIQKEFGFSNAHLGYVFSAFATAYACCMLIGGLLADKIGPRLALTLYGLIWAAATIVSGLSASLGQLVASRFVVGMGESAVYPTVARVVTTWIPDARRGSAQGMIHAIGRIGNAAAPILVTSLIIASSWRTAFLILGAVTALYVAFLYAYLRDDPHAHPAVTSAELAQLPPARMRATETTIHWGRFVRRVWPATAVAFCHGWMLWFFLNWIPTYFAHAQGLALKESAVFSTLVLVGGVAGTGCGGLVTDWWFRRSGDRLRGRRDVIMVAFIASGLALLPLLFGAGLVVSACALGVAFFISELGDAPLWMVATEVEPAHAATSAAATFTGMAIAGAVSPVVVGWLLDLTGGSWTAAFALSIAVLLLGPLFALQVRLPSDLPSHQVVPLEATPAL